LPISEIGRHLNWTSKLILQQRDAAAAAQEEND